MAKILAIIWQDLRVFLSQRSNLPGLLITPVVMTVIIGLVGGGAFDGGGVPVRRLDVIDLDASPASGQFLSAARQANPSLTLCPMDDTGDGRCNLDENGSLTESQALDRVADGTSLGLLVIPAGFEANLAAQEPITLAFHSSSSFGVSQPAQQAVEAALSQINTAAVASQVGLSVVNRLFLQPLDEDQAQQMQRGLYQRALQMSREQTIRVDFALSASQPERSVGESLQLGLGQSVPGMGTMFVLMTLFGSMSALIVEREQWTLQRLAAMPVSRSALLAGKILARFCLGLLQFLIVFVVGALFRMDFGTDPLALLLLVIVYTLSVTALSFAIGSGLKNTAQASGLGLLLTLTLAPLGGAWWPIDISPRFLQIIGHVSPVAWAMEGFNALIFNDARLEDILISLAVLVGMTMVAFVIAIPRFRYKVD